MYLSACLALFSVVVVVVVVDVVVVVLAVYPCYCIRSVQMLITMAGTAH